MIIFPLNGKMIIIKKYFFSRFVASPLYRNMLKTYGGSVKDLDAAITTSS